MGKRQTQICRQQVKVARGTGGADWVVKVKVKPEKPMFVLPVTTRTNKQRQGLNLYGLYSDGWRSERMAGYIPKWTVLNSILHPPFL